MWEVILVIGGKVKRSRFLLEGVEFMVELGLIRILVIARMLWMGL